MNTSLQYAITDSRGARASTSVQITVDPNVPLERPIARDDRVSLMFLIRGSGNVIRINGRARITDDPDLRASFTHDGKQPRTVIVIRIAEVYFQCARAVIRPGLWSGQADSAGLPTPGQILASLTDNEVGGDAYDTAWPIRAAQTMW